MKLLAIFSVFFLTACARYTPPPESTPTAKIRFVAEDEEIGVQVTLKDEAKCKSIKGETVSRLRKTPSWLNKDYDNRMDLKMPLGDDIPINLKSEFTIPANEKIGFAFGLGATAVCKPQFLFNPSTDHMYEAIYKLHGSGLGTYCTIEVFEIKENSNGYYRQRMVNGDSELELCKPRGS